MLKKVSLMLAVIGSLASYSSAKLDYGPCPSPITQTPFDVSLIGTYYLQYYDNVLDYLWPVVQAMYKYNKPDCLSKAYSTSEWAYDRDSRPLKKKIFQPYIVY